MMVQENSEEESGITVIEVVRSNMAQKGTITVEKVWRGIQLCGRR